MGVVAGYASLTRPTILNVESIEKRYKERESMKVVTYSHARHALKSVLDSVLQDADVTIISRRDAPLRAIPSLVSANLSRCAVIYPAIGQGEFVQSLKITPSHHSWRLPNLPRSNRPGPHGHGGGLHQRFHRYTEPRYAVPAHRPASCAGKRWWCSA